MHAAGKVSELELKAWETIDFGVMNDNEDKIWEGNRLIADYEQNVFLEQHVFGKASQSFNTFGAIGDSTGTSSPLPGGTVLNAAVPGGQLGNRQDRWKWISETMLVEWRKVENTPEIQATLRRFAELQ